MEILIQLVNDIGKLWAKYGASYLTGMRNTLILALTATAIGCVIGFLCGVLTLICDLLKGFLPVFLYTRGTATVMLALVMAAPVIGHVFPVLFRFRGGKGIATTFGCLLGLLPNYIPVGLLALLFIFFSLILRITPHYYRTLATYLGAELLLFVFSGEPAVWIGFSLILAAVTVRMLTSKEEKTPPEVKLLWMR